MRMSWSVEKVIQSAGIELKDADDELIAMAEDCLEQCYYIDRSAEELIRRLWPSYERVYR